MTGRPRKLTNKNQPRKYSLKPYPLNTKNFCVHNTNYKKCFFKNFPKSQLIKLNSLFNNETSISAQNKFLTRYINITYSDRSRQNKTTKLILTHPRSGDLLICKKAFLSVFPISQTRLEKIAKSIKENYKTYESSSGGSRKTEESINLTEKIKNYIEEVHENYTENKIHYNR